MLTIRRYLLAFICAIKLHVEVCRIRRRLTGLLGRDQVRKLFGELYLPVHIKAVSALFDVAARRSKSRELHDERQANYKLWRRLVEAPSHESDFHSAAACSISRAVIARSMRDICGESPRLELLNNLPPLNSVGQFLRRWLEMCGASERLASREVLAQNVNYFCASYATLAACGGECENWTPDLEQLRKRSREEKQWEALWEEELHTEYQIQLLRLLAFPLAMYKVTRGK